MRGQRPEEREGRRHVADDQRETQVALQPDLQEVPAGDHGAHQTRERDPRAAPRAPAGADAHPHVPHPHQPERKHKQRRGQHVRVQRVGLERVVRERELVGRLHQVGHEPEG